MVKFFIEIKERERKKKQRFVIFRKIKRIGRNSKGYSIKVKKMIYLRVNILIKVINMNGLNFIIRRQIGLKIKFKCMVFSRGGLKQMIQRN